MPIINNSHCNDEYFRENQFTDDAAKLARDAIERIYGRSQGGQVPAAMLLWAIVRWEKKLGVAALEHCGVNLRDFELDLEQCLGGERLTKNGVVDFGQLDSAVVQASAESARLQDAYVGTEHLVLALLNGGSPPLRALFERYGVTGECYEESIRILKR